MNRNTILAEINKIKDKSILNKKEYLIKKLLTLNLNDELLQYGINIIELYDYNTAYEALKILEENKNIIIAKCLTNSNTIRNKISIQGAKLLSEGKEIFNFANGYDVVTNVNAINANIALEGVKLINKSKQWFNAYYARYPLTSKNAIINNIALTGAELINASDKEYKALFLSIILCNKYAIKEKFTLSLAEKINSLDEYNNINKVIDEYLKGKIEYFEEDNLYKDTIFSVLANNIIRKKCKVSKENI